MPNSPCWGCRWRRVRCDSQQPACNKCTRKGLLCPGYGNTKPLKWRHRIVQLDQQQVVLQPRLPSADAMASKDLPIHLAHNVMSYYNAMIVPDLSPCGTSVHCITVEDWASVGELPKHLYVCMVSLHRVVKCLGNEDENRALILNHQAYAARRLYQMIIDVAHPRLDTRLVEAACMFLCLDIQQSAYGAWRTHLKGAKALIGSWEEDMQGRDDFVRFVISVIDIYGATMTPSKLLLEDTLAEHLLYLRIVGSLQVDVLSTLTPIPLEILKATIAINSHRAAVTDQHRISDQQRYQHLPSLNAILASLRQFDSYRWAYGLPSQYVLEAENWALFATCYQSATTLYLFQSCSPTADCSTGDELQNNTRRATYHILVKSITELFGRRLQGCTHYKYVLWPMVICGIESAARGERNDLKFLCSSLETTTLDLGTLSMREAAEFLENVWAGCGLRRSHLMDCVAIDWDETFKLAPIFLI
ncbi:hypothetical protein HBH68_176670 [Parastagonospora nodorum]|nr:hypothetical protein HBH68_176670 [Parastagonospora nodorum]